MPDRLEEVSITVDDRRWRAWSGLEITRTIDKLSTVSFEAPFEPERDAFRETFRPFSFKPLELHVGEELLFTGTLVDVRPSVDPDKKTVEASGYARPGALLDCNAPASAWPLELNGLKLGRIAETLLEPFGIDVQVDADEGAAFRRVALRPNEKIHSFLGKLARQRGLIMADTPEGALRFYRSTATGSPVVRLREGEPPLTSVEPSFNPQAYFSEITGRAQARAGAAGSGHTVQNEHLGVLRPHAFTLEDTDDADAPAATEAKLGRMFGNMVTLRAEVPTWRDPDATLWKPDTTVMLEAPGAMVYSETEFLVRDVTLRQDAGSITAELGLVLPGAFSGEVPQELPWD